MVLGYQRSKKNSLALSLIGLVLLAVGGVFIALKLGSDGDTGPEQSEASTQAPVGGACTKDAECVNYSFCQATTKKCTALLPYNAGGSTAIPIDKDILMFCNRNVCWIYNSAKSKWEGGGASFLLSQVSPWKDTKAVGNIRLWSLLGPTAAWENKSVVTICNRNICWDLDKATKTFKNDGAGYDISKNAEWLKAKKLGERLPWSDGGPNFAVKWPTGVVIFMCSKGDCWNQKVGDEVSWANGGVGSTFEKACPIVQATAKCAETKPANANNLNLTTNAGPRTGWVGQGGHMFYCNQGYCWESTSTGWVNEGKPFVFATDARYKGAKPFTPAKPTPSVIAKEPADLDASGKVDIMDFGLFAKFYSEEDTKADLNLNKDIDIGDFGNFKKEYEEQNL